MILWASAPRPAAPNSTTSVRTIVQFWPVSTGGCRGARAPGGPLYSRLTAACSWPVPGLAQPGVDLLLDNLEDCRIGADERREIRRPHDQGHHCLTGHHGRGARVHLKGSPLSDQLTRTTYGQDMFGAVLTDPDFGEAAENDGRVVTVLSLLHELGADGEYPLVGPGPESALLICGEGVPEIDHGLVLFWWCPPLSRVAAVTVRFLRESCPPRGRYLPVFCVTESRFRGEPGIPGIQLGRALVTQVGLARLTLA